MLNSKIKLIVFALFALTMISCNDSEFSSAGCAGSDCGDVVTPASVFSWDYGSWSQCSKACGGGDQTRTVACVDKNDVVVPDSECVGTKPQSNQICNSQACVSQYNWNIGPYGMCSKSCGGGTKSRVVSCQHQNGSYSNDSNCPAPKPSTTSICNPDTCPETYSWVPGAWSTCSKTCGGGSRTRSVTCRTAQGIIADESFCSGTKPAETEPCNVQNCNFGYTWVTGSWGNCSKECEGGKQYRSLGCLRDDGVYVPQSLCTATRPAIERACNTQACPAACTTYPINKSVADSENQLDILIVVDDSGSMAADNLKLARKLNSFVSNVESSNLDWRMCITTTDVGYYEGRPLEWQGQSDYILKKGDSNLTQTFVDTMKFIGSGWSTDEQGIKAMNLSVKDNSRSKCFRQKAGLAVIVISDEDERSVGGNKSLNATQYKPLGPLNEPSSFASTIKEEFGTGKRYSVNSIVVTKKQCRDQQNAEGDPSFYGLKYQQLSGLSGGGVGSICDSDYSNNLTLFANTITKKLSTYKMQCKPDESPKVFVDGVNYNSNITVQDDSIIFNPVVRGPANVTGSYCCKK